MHIITRGQGESEVGESEKDTEVENPQKKEFDPKKLSAESRMKGKNKEW